ncbi:hypothetical protein QBC45DRAFT_152257 [Copromyces sp. CBS 386.78]|nr:hypothetical protein QBC45DRAFT_152257 [Copromyces sp. CBS 386.78]
MPNSYHPFPSSPVVNLGTGNDIHRDDFFVVVLQGRLGTEQWPCHCQGTTTSFVSITTDNPPLCKTGKLHKENTASTVAQWHQILRSGQGPMAPRTARTLCASVPLGRLFFLFLTPEWPEPDIYATSGNVFQPSRFVFSTVNTRHHASESGRHQDRLWNSGSDRRKAARSRVYKFSLFKNYLCRAKGEHGCHLITALLEKKQQKVGRDGIAGPWAIMLSVIRTPIDGRLVPPVGGTRTFSTVPSRQQRQSSRTKIQNSHMARIHPEAQRHSALCNPYQEFAMHPRAILPLHKEINSHNVVSGGGTDDA